MSTRFSYCWRRALPTGVAAILCFLVASSPVIGLESSMLFMGAGFGPTPEVAIRSAIGDAETSASAYQLFTCEMVGEPSIFPGPNPEWGRNFRAGVTLACTP
jgi:hypothetical protein